MPLTEEQSKRYLENLSLCPFCQSSQIVAGHIEINDGYAFQPIFCSDCGIHKQISPDSCFNKSAGRLERWRAWCKDCERTKANEFYHKNPDSYKKRARIFQTELRKLLKERGERIKAMYGCRLCGESEISCLDFHHLLEKERNIGNASTTASFEKELVKCVVLCSNCHRKVHSGVSKVSTDMLCKKHDGI